MKTVAVQTPPARLSTRERSSADSLDSERRRIPSRGVLPQQAAQCPQSNIVRRAEGKHRIAASPCDRPAQLSWVEPERLCTIHMPRQIIQDGYRERRTSSRTTMAGLRRRISKVNVSNAGAVGPFKLLRCPSELKSSRGLPPQCRSNRSIAHSRPESSHRKMRPKSSWCSSK